MDNEKYKDIILSLAAENNDYDSHAYFFVNDAVTHTVEKAAHAADKHGARHVSGQELIAGAIEYAIQRYSALAPSVFEYWGLHSGTDMGNIVFRMIAAGILSASPHDHRNDFDGPENLPEILRRHLAALKKKQSDPPHLSPIA